MFLKKDNEKTVTSGSTPIKTCRIIIDIVLFGELNFPMYAPNPVSNIQFESSIPMTSSLLLNADRNSRIRIIWVITDVKPREIAEN